MFPLIFVGACVWILEGQHVASEVATQIIVRGKCTSPFSFSTDKDRKAWFSSLPDIVSDTNGKRICGNIDQTIIQKLKRDLIGH